jgi:hypothetical protein
VQFADSRLSIPKEKKQTNFRAIAQLLEGVFSLVGNYGISANHAGAAY